jgi:O-antigen ligase
MAYAATSTPTPRLLLASGLILSLALLSFWIAREPIQFPLLGCLAAILVLATIAHPDAGLIILILSMLFSPELPILGGGGRGIEGTRQVTLRTDDLTLLLVGFAWIARMGMHKDLGAIRRTRLNRWIAFYAGCCLLSTLLGIEAGGVKALVGLCFVAKYVEYFIIFFITVNYVRTEEAFRRLLAAVLATAALIVLYAYWQIPSGVRPSAPFEGREGEPNTLGGYLVLISSVAIAIALTAADRRWKRPCAVLAMLAPLPLLATLSRSSWIGACCALLTLFVLSPGRRRLAGALILAAALLFFLHPRAVENRIAYTFEGEESGSLSVGRLRLDPSSSARIGSWGTALAGFERRPILGWGVTGYGFMDAQYFRILVELGLVGFAAFVCLIGAVGRMTYAAFRDLSDPLHRALGLGMTAGLAGLLGHSIGTNTFLLIRIMEPFWLLTALVVVSSRLERPGVSPSVGAGRGGEPA